MLLVHEREIGELWISKAAHSVILQKEFAMIEHNTFIKHRLQLEQELFIEMKEDAEIEYHNFTTNG